MCYNYVSDTEHYAITSDGYVVRIIRRCKSLDKVWVTLTSVQSSPILWTEAARYKTIIGHYKYFNHRDARGWYKV